MPAANVRKVFFANAEGDHEEHNFETDMFKLAKLVLDTTNVDDVDALVITAGDVNLSNVAKIKGVVNPTEPQDAATKQYVDATASGLDVKQSVRFGSVAEATAAVYAENGAKSFGAFGDTLTAAAVGAIDADPAFEMAGLTPAVGDRVLVKNQTAAAAYQNGLYTITTVGGVADKWVLTRAIDADNSDVDDSNAVAEVTEGLFCFIEEGPDLQDTSWVLSSDATPDLTSVAVTFSQFSSSADVNGGDNIIRDGNSIEYRSSINTIVLGQGKGDADTGIETLVAHAGSAVTGAKNTREHQVVVSDDPANNGLILNDDAVTDTEVKASAGIQASKLDIGGDESSYDTSSRVTAYNSSTNSYVVSSSDATTVKAVLEDVEAYLASLDEETDGFSGGDKIAITPIVGFASTVDTVQEMLEAITGPEIVTSAGVAKGDVVYVDAATGLGKYDATTVEDRPIGIAAETVGAAAAAKVLVSGQIYDSGATPFTKGQRYFWSGTAFVATPPSGPGLYVYQVGVAISTAELLIDIDFIKKNVGV